MEASANSPPSSTGSCLCQAISLEMKGEPMYAVLCHCTNCQKACGSAFGANLFFKEANVTIHDAQEQLRWFQDGDTPSSRPIFRGFCAACGSRMFVRPTTLPGKDPILLVASGVVEDIHLKDKKWQPTVEGFCTRKRSWLGSLEGIKSFDGMFKLKS